MWTTLHYPPCTQESIHPRKCQCCRASKHTRNLSRLDASKKWLVSFFSIFFFLFSLHDHPRIQLHENQFPEKMMYAIRRPHAIHCRKVWHSLFCQRWNLQQCLSAGWVGGIARCGIVLPRVAVGKKFIPGIASSTNPTAVSNGALNILCHEDSVHRNANFNSLILSIRCLLVENGQSTCIDVLVALMYECINISTYQCRSASPFFSVPVFRCSC